VFTKGYGESNERGFRIVDTQRNVTVQTEHFSEGKINGTKRFTFKVWPILVGMILWGATASFLLSLLATFPLWARIVIVALSNLFFLFLAIMGPIIFFALKIIFQGWRKKDLLEWHGLEHKVAGLLVEGMEPTIENLRSIPRIQPACGSHLPNFIQKFLTTREPSLDKLEAGLKLVMEYYITIGSGKQT